MAIGTYGVVVSIGGSTINKQISRTADHPNPYPDIPLPVAKTGTLSTRTNDTDGELTMTGGHGITTGQIIDIYWTGGGCAYGATVGTVSVNAVPFTGATGDVLPSQSTAITAAVQVVINTQIDGDAVKLFALELASTDTNATGAGHIVFHDASHAPIEAYELTANAPVVMDVVGGAANLLTGNLITHSHATNGSATDTGVTITILSLEDSTP